MANNLWSNYTQKDTPVDNDELMIYDSEGKSNKRLLFGGFWKWIAKKLKEAELSDLQTADKTIIGAINTLNSDSPKNVIIFEISADNNSTTFLLKEPEKNTSSFSRKTALLCICDQGGTLVGLYVIGFSKGVNTISTITGINATISRNEDYLTVTFDTNGIWSTGFVIANV